MAGSKVPTDPSISIEMRRFLDNLSRNQKFANLVAETLEVGSITTDELTIGGLNPFLQGGIADEGLNHNWVDHETVSSGTLTIDPLAGYWQKVTITGAVSIAPVSDRVGNCILHVKNGASANASFTGWNYKFSGAITTTLNDRFWVPMYFGGSEGADYMIQRRQ